MKILVADIKDTLIFNITGEEDWLDFVYTYFPYPEQCSKPLITGSLQFVKHKETLIKVHGNLQYTPYVLCSRCGEYIRWPIDTQFDVIYTTFNKKLNQIKVYDLSFDELDEYFIADDGTIDLLELVNDQILISIPQQTVLLKEDGKTCRICNLICADETNCVYNNEVNNPFYELKQKLKF